MANLSKLSAVRTMVKGELGWQTNASASTVQDTEINTLIENEQWWLASENDWPFLKINQDVPVAANTQYVLLPNTINFQRATSLIVSVFYNQIYQPLICGIGIDQYNSVNFVIGQTQNPIQRWDFAANSAYGVIDNAQQYFEVWPVGTQTQPVRFTGQSFVGTLRNNDNTFNDNALISLDDLLITLFVVAKLGSRRKDPAAQEALARANRRMNDLRAAYPKKQDRVIVRGDSSIGTKLVRQLPIITVAPRG